MDLAVLGHHGWLDFTRISQGWLRESAKAWASHDLPKRRGRQAGARLHEITGAIIRLSETLRAGREDHGEDPSALGRADVEAFLHRMAFLAADGKLSHYCRVKTCQDAGRVLKGIRSLGLARPGSPAAGLADDFTLIAGDVPAKADPGEPGRDVPDEIMRQLVGRLRELEEVISCRETRVAVELMIDTGRRPAEVCALDWDCLARDADGTPGAGLRQRQVPPAAPPPARQRAHRHAGHRAEGRRPRALPGHSACPAEAAAVAAAQPRRDPPRHRGQPHRPAPHLGELDGTAAAGRRDRVRQVPYQPVLLPALLRATAC